MAALRRHHRILVTLLACIGSPWVAAPAQVPTSAVDQVFANYAGPDVPGCAVAVSEGGVQVLARAYGMADLEHDIANTPATVFEPGSVSKQFTAAATILLALDGKLSLDDDVRKYVPELPDYGETITIRHLLNHTSGLRDWGAIAGIGGWPRTTRVHTHTHMLDIASRQQSLNYRPGEYYSYTNTGYNLQAVIVARVSGQSFADFSRERLFEPLGMANTEWRDDFTRVVKNRSIAYSRSRSGGYRMNMPFENVHGNGGLLTTVGDLLKFTHNLETGALGGPTFLAEMHTQGVLNSGRTIAYAGGLFVGEYKGVPEVQHSGGTAGYRGFLTRFPDQGVAVSVMCNNGSASAGGLAHRVADLYLGDAIVGDSAEPKLPVAVTLPADHLERLAGTYKRMRDRLPVSITISNGTLQIGSRALVPVSNTRFLLGTSGVSIEFDAEYAGDRPGGVTRMPNGEAFRLDPVAAANPSAADLGQYVGAYRSEEAEVTYRFEVRDGRLVRVDRYGVGAPLSPAYLDAFRGAGGLYIFRRDGGRVEGFSLVQGRVWDLEFARQR